MNDTKNNLNTTKSESLDELIGTEYCPECGAPMKEAMLDDDVGHGMHDGHECPDCGYTL